MGFRGSVCTAPFLSRSCPLYPQKRTWIGTVLMSALCQKQTFTGLTASCLRRLMPLQERACAVDGASLQLRRLLPGKHRDLGIGRQRGDVDRDLERMRRYIVG